ncbi:MAG: TonB-dependent receptor [Tannerella sp.]|jgi:TonB-linked SusC/RagA family outer membrane protein|nr:TonB-dependent receptor [Tannerella sp.]
MRKKLCAFIMFLLLAPFSLIAQQKSYTMSGKTTDENGESMPGVTVYIKDKPGGGLITDGEGKFTIKAERGDRLMFSFIGYENYEYLVTEEKKDLTIQMSLLTQEIEEVVIVASGVQRKISSVAAITSVNAKDLQVPAPSITNMLGGRVAGVITMQSSGEPGKNLAEFWVRGIGTFGANSNALVLIDGLEGDINAIDPADIEGFSVLKDASATAIYGSRGANGVVLITTKRGEEGKLKITGRANFSLSQVKRLPKYLRAYDYALLANEAYEVRGEQAIYSDIQLDVIRDGLDPDLYPDVNWQDEILNKASFKQTYYANAAGGGSIARYFVSLGYSNETAAYKAEKDNPYASNAGYKTFSFRTNLDIDLTKTTALHFGANAFLSINNQPGIVNTDYVWAAQAYVTPLLFPTVYSNGQLPAAGTDNNVSSPYVLINHTGKSSSQNNQNLFTLGISQDLKFVTEGLKLNIQGSYNRNGTLSEGRYIFPALYRAIGRNNIGNLVTREQRAKTDLIYTKGETAFRKFWMQADLLYDCLFNEDHRVGSLIRYNISDQQNTADIDNSLSAIPVRYQTIAARVTYGYKDTYLTDLNFSYMGSENFIPGKQYGFFPSFGLGWVVTGYEWTKDNLPWLSLLKIRGTYGIVGNDRLTDTRFPYLTRVSMGNRNIWGSSSTVETVRVSNEGADNLLWEKAVKTDFGLDLQLLDNKITFSGDIWQDQRNGIFQQRVQIPDYVGLISMPYGNVGKMKSWGSDGSASYLFEIDKDMSFSLRANYTYAQNLVQNWERLNEQYPYMEWHGQPYQGVRGLQCIGFFKDEDDIKYSPKQAWGEVMPGDLKYKDINGDGKVNDDDKVPLSYKSMFPLITYGAGAEFNYKNLSVGFLFQGTGKVDYFSNGYGYIPFAGGETGNILEQFKDPSTRWIPKDYALSHGIDPNLAENPNALLPRLQYGNNNNNSQTSDFWKGDASYLRFKELMVSYRLKDKFLQKAGVSSIDLQFIGNNLYVWDKVKIFDPEQAEKRGAVYPIPAVYSFQVYIVL